MEIDGREVEFKASAAVPRIYRMKFRRDLFVDLQKIAKSVKKKGKKEDKESSEIPIEDLEMFENIAYVMAQHADPETLWTGWSSSTHSLFTRSCLPFWNSGI